MVSRDNGGPDSKEQMGLKTLQRDGFGRTQVMATGSFFDVFLRQWRSIEEQQNWSVRLMAYLYSVPLAAN